MKKFFADLLAKVAGNAVLIIGFILLVLVGIQVAYCRAQNEREKAKAAETEELRKQIAALTVELGGVKGTMIKEREAKLSDLQQEFLKAIRALDKKASVESTSSTGVHIKDEAKGTVAPTYVEDQYHRFRFDLPSGDLHREQKFTLSTVTVRGVDGSYKLQKSEFKEFDPKTGEEIPSSGVELTGDYKYVEEKAPGPGPWHMRFVVGGGYPWAVGGGVQFNPWGHWTLGAVGLYRTSEKDGVIAATVGWRLFNSTVSVGPYGGVSTKGTLTGGVVGTIEVTR